MLLAGLAKCLATPSTISLEVAADIIITLQVSRRPINLLTQHTLSRCLWNVKCSLHVLISQLGVSHIVSQGPINEV